jgi:hypothetical protein
MKHLLSPLQTRTSQGSSTPTCKTGRSSHCMPTAAWEAMASPPRAPDTGVVLHVVDATVLSNVGRTRFVVFRIELAYRRFYWHVGKVSPRCCRENDMIVAIAGPCHTYGGEAGRMRTTV